VIVACFCSTASSPRALKAGIGGELFAKIVVEDDVVTSELATGTVVDASIGSCEEPSTNGGELSDTIDVSAIPGVTTGKPCPLVV